MPSKKRLNQAYNMQTIYTQSYRIHKEICNQSSISVKRIAYREVCQKTRQQLILLSPAVILQKLPFKKRYITNTGIENVLTKSTIKNDASVDYTKANNIVGVANSQNNLINKNALETNNIVVEKSTKVLNQSTDLMEIDIDNVDCNESTNLMEFREITDCHYFYNNLFNNCSKKISPELLNDNDFELKTPTHNTDNVSQEGCLYVTGPPEQFGTTVRPTTFPSISATAASTTNTDKNSLEPSSVNIHSKDIDPLDFASNEAVVENVRTFNKSHYLNGLEVKDDKINNSQMCQLNQTPVKRTTPQSVIATNLKVIDSSESYQTIYQSNDAENENTLNVINDNNHFNLLTIQENEGI